MDNIEEFRQKCNRLTLTDAAASTDSIFLEKKRPEVRKILRRKLNAVKQEKISLEEIISSKNHEIDDLKKSIRSLNEVINSVPIEDLKNNSSIASSKIVELSKKNRILRSDLESVRNRNTRLESRVLCLENDLKKLQDKKKDIIPPKMPESAADELQNKLNQTKQKLFESLNQNVELKTQLKIAQKCIQQEIGENINLNTLVASGPTWRGRAQQIISLQLKVNELKEQLENVRSECHWTDEAPDEPPIRREQIYHRAEVDILQKDITALRGHIEELNQKIAALKARNKNLVADIGKMKEKSANMESLSKSNDAAIDTLNEKLQVQKFHYENKVREMQKDINDARKERDNLDYEREEMKVKLENIQSSLNAKEETINDQKATIKKLERDLKSVCGDFLFECRDFKKEEFVAILDSIESEKNNLLSLNRTLNDRLEEERMRVLNHADQISKLKIKICRLEAKIRDLEKEHDSQSEKKKRQNRISEYASSINNTSKVSSFIFENSSFSEFPGKCEDEDQAAFQITEFKNRLELANEKISLLEDRLNYLNEEKQNDAKTFENIIKMSKSVVLDTILQLKTDE